MNKIKHLTRHIATLKSRIHVLIAGIVLGGILLNFSYCMFAVYQLTFVFAKPIEQRFLPMPKPIETENITEEHAGGMGTIWDSWKQEYTTARSVTAVLLYYNQEMQTYCETPFTWTEVNDTYTAKCYIDPCEPPGMPEHHVTGRGPYQTFHVELQAITSEATQVVQTSFHSSDVCFEHPTPG